MGRTEKRHHPETGKTYPWIVKSTAMGELQSSGTAELNRVRLQSGKAPRRAYPDSSEPSPSRCLIR